MNSIIMNSTISAFALNQNCIPSHIIRQKINKRQFHIMQFAELNDNISAESSAPVLPRSASSPHKNGKKKKVPNIIKRNKSTKYCKIPAAKKKSVFGTATTDRNEINSSKLPGPGAYGINTSTFDATKSPQSPKSKSTFGTSTKEAAKEVIKSAKLGPGIYASPKHKVNGGTWSKAMRQVSTINNFKKTASPGPGEYKAVQQAENPIFTQAEKNFQSSQFDWKWYRTQYHNVISNGMTKNDVVKSPKSLKSCNVSSKFRNISFSPTHNKNGFNHFGTSPRFADKTSNPVNLSSFKGEHNVSVKNILSSSEC
eukprot:206145_1